MVRRTGKKSATSEEKRFVLHSLHRLKNADQRYLFTLMVDVISIGLAAAQSRKKSAKKD